MRFGLFGGPARRPGQATDAEAYSAYIESVREAERLGFYGAYLVEHHFTGRGQVSASLNVLSHLAALTSTIRLGTAVVVVPWHNPALIAEQAATVDVLSGGRLDLGLGRGYRDNEFAGFGVAREEAEGRYRDTLAFLRQAWRTSEPFTFNGEHVTLTDVVIEPQPLQTPHPPLWVGAASPASLRDAGTNGLKLFLDQVATLEELAERVRIYRDAQRAAGLPADPHDIALTRPLLLAEDAPDRAKLLDSHLETLATLASSAADTERNPFYSNPAERRARAENGAILGEANECLERLAQIQSIGIQQVLFTRTTPTTLGRFAERVIARLPG